MPRKPKTATVVVPTIAATTTATTSDQLATTPPVVDPEEALRPGGPAQRNRDREPDDAFFAELPEGFIVPRRADYLGDVISRLGDFPSDVEKVIWLRHNMSPALTYLLRLAFCKDVEWYIPVGLPVYKAWKGRRYSSPSELKRELRRLYLFLKGGNDAIDGEKRQKLFQQTIEGLESTELGVLVSIKDHTLDADYGLTEELVTLAFPGVLDAPFTPKFIK